MKRLAIAMLFFLVPAAAWADKPVAEWKKWTSCEKDEDCVLIFGQCATFIAMNAKYTEEYLEYLKYITEVSKCTNPDKIEMSNQLIPICMNKKCGISARDAKPGIGK